METIQLVNGFTIYTIPSDDDEKLRSINAGLIHLEEASGINRTIYDQLLTRMRDPFVKNKFYSSAPIRN
jgi:phage terminase large subunit